MTVVGTALREALHTLKLSGTSETLHTRLTPSPHRETRTPRLLQVLCHGEITPPRADTQRRYRVTQATSRD